jgi:hypothetical protein
MFWSLSFRLLTGEHVIDDSTRKKNPMVKPVYSVFITNKRAVFRFDGLGSSMTQSFFFDDIMDASPCKRLFITYLLLKTEKKDYLINIFDAEYWSEIIMKTKAQHIDYPQSDASAETLSSDPQIRKQKLGYMISELKKNSLLSEEEFSEKMKKLDEQ